MYDELSGTLATPTTRAPGAGDRVVFSDLKRGTARTTGHSFSVKYVARGQVRHHVGRRTFVVGAGQFICMPEGVDSELEIGRADDASMVGVCLFLGGGAAPGPVLEEPVVFPAACSSLGRLLAREVVDFQGSSLRRADRAGALLRRVGGDLETLLEDTARSLASLTAAKPATRYEGLRRLNLARGHLHAITDRPVELGELARVAGLSRFQLLRDFSASFGAPPITYHRCVRLRLAKQAIDAGALDCSQAAHRHGFADASSLSHAYRRAFGTGLVRSLGGLARPA